MRNVNSSRPRDLALQETLRVGGYAEVLRPTSVPQKFAVRITFCG